MTKATSTPDLPAPLPSSSWQRGLRWFLIAIPWILSAWLVRKYALDQRIMDDWLLGEDLVKWKAGQISLGDLFGAQMEHRLFVPRLLALGLGLALQGDVRALVGLTMLFFTCEYLLVVWLWFRRTDLGAWPATVGCFLSGLLLLTPMKFQTFHFPICFITIMPLASLAGALRVAQSHWPTWLRFVLCCCCGWVGMFSFAPGMLTWVLPLPIFLWVAPMADSRQRRNFVLAWLVVCVLSFFLYFHNLQNEVFAAYSYGQGKQNVLGHDAAYFLQHLGMAVGFYLRWMGSFLSHGWRLPQAEVAMAFGIALLLLYVFVVFYTLKNWADALLRKKMIPWLCYATYSLCTGGMVTVGRLWMEPHEQSSLNLRYHVHQTPLVIGLLAGIWIVARHWLARRPRRAAVPLTHLGWACLGGLLILQVQQWTYGQNLMHLWWQQHVQVGLVQRFWNVSQDNFYLNKLAGDFIYGRDVATKLEKLGYLKKFFPSDQLAQFKQISNPGTSNFGSFDQLWKEPDGRWFVRGYSLYNRPPGSKKDARKTSQEDEDREYYQSDYDHPPSDLVLLTYRENPQASWHIFAFVCLDCVPFPLHEWYQKDFEGIGYHIWPWPRRMNGEWASEVGMIKEPPTTAEISAWALDDQDMTVRRVPFGHGFANGRSPEELGKLEALPLPDLMRGFSEDPAAILSSKPSATPPTHD